MRAAPPSGSLRNTNVAASRLAATDIDAEDALTGSTPVVVSGDAEEAAAAAQVGVSVGAQVPAAEAAAAQSVVERSDDGGQKG